MTPLREINPDKYEYVSDGPKNLPDDGGKTGDVLVCHDTRGEDKDMPYLWVAAWIDGMSTRPEGWACVARITSFEPTTDPRCRWMRKKPLWKQLGNLCPCAFDGSKDHVSYCVDGRGAKEAGFPKDYVPPNSQV